MAQPDYSQFENSIEIPFTNREGATPAIKVEVNGTVIENCGLDSGSTIFAITKNFVPDFPADTSALTPGNVGYSTSNRQWDGFWYPVKVKFSGKNDDGQAVSAVAELQALVVTKQTTDDGEENDMIHYMGIAFGILNSQKGFTPEKNATLPLKEFNDQPTNDTTFRHGYIMREKSIVLGLTAKNTSSFKFTKLSAGSNDEVKWYWENVRAAVQLGDAAWMHGKALVDSGVSTMQLYSTQNENNFVVPPNTKVSIRFPDDNSTLPEYSFIWPGNDAKTRDEGTPEKLEVFKSIYDTSFVNTGQNFLEKFDVLFDADEGYFGLKEVAN